MRQNSPTLLPLVDLLEFDKWQMPMWSSAFPFKHSPILLCFFRSHFLLFKKRSRKEIFVYMRAKKMLPGNQIIEYYLVQNISIKNGNQTEMQIELI
jgi:hypothetical protein